MYWVPSSSETSYKMSFENLLSLEEKVSGTGGVNYFFAAKENCNLLRENGSLWLNP